MRAFLRECCRIQDHTGEWVSFDLWTGQESCLQTIEERRLLVLLKARQLGMTWLVLGHALHQLLFHPGITVLLFSLRDKEATEMLQRLCDMYRHLPEWLRRGVSGRNRHDWMLPNGSRALAFPASAGDSYTAGLAIVDEADLIPNLERLLGRVKPTIDAGGQLILLSRVDKSKPESAFKRLYRSAREGSSPWHPVFLPWHVRPDRTPEWYEEQKRDSLARCGSLDALWEQYPATDAEALATRSLDKRIPTWWLQQVWKELPLLDPIQLLLEKCPWNKGMAVYEPPQAGVDYVIGGDPAEGNPQSDDSALVVLKVKEGEEVCSYHGKLEPSDFGLLVSRLSTYYNDASALIERNNHGHAVLNWLRTTHQRVRLLRGLDNKDGWYTGEMSKTHLLDTFAEACRDQEVVIRTPAVYFQLAELEGSTNRAPPGMHDDLAMAMVLAHRGRAQAQRSGWRLQQF